MEIKQQKKNEILIISLSGRLDATTSGYFEKTILPAISNGENKILLDLATLDYISSAGLRIMLLAAKNVKANNGKIVLSSMKSFIKEIFDIAGFTPIFSLCNSLDEAIKEF